jgi:hypothetical protein
VGLLFSADSEKPLLRPDPVVERIVAEANQVQVVIKNQGDATVQPAGEFWVDRARPGASPGAAAPIRQQTRAAAQAVI